MHKKYERKLLNNKDINRNYYSFFQEVQDRNRSFLCFKKNN